MFAVFVCIFSIVFISSQGLPSLFLSDAVRNLLLYDATNEEYCRWMNGKPGEGTVSYTRGKKNKVVAVICVVYSTEILDAARHVIHC